MGLSTGSTQNNVVIITLIIILWKKNGNLCGYSEGDKTVTWLIDVVIG